MFSGKILLIAVAVGNAVAHGPLRTIRYESHNDRIVNPERGFYRFSELTDNDAEQYRDVRAGGDSLVYGLVVARDFRDRPLGPAFLDSVQAGFDAARRNGVKVKFRFVYNYESDGEDAPLDIVLAHIRQLRPLWVANKDVLFHVDAGFIGKWGEWHGSTNGLGTPANRAAILTAILDALPVDRTVGIRYPHYKREIFGGALDSDSAKIDASNAFDGSNLSRVGHLNDCLWANHHDEGTYFTRGWSRQRELRYIGTESRYAAHGGESCRLSAYSSAENAIAEMRQLHTDYLHRGFHREVLQAWRDSGAFDEIDRRLGYRFELREAKLPKQVRPGGLLPIELVIDNVGFGELFNPRPVELTLTNVATAATTTIALGVDPRLWAGGERHTVSSQLVVPKTLPTGKYSVGLWLPDAEESLRGDPRYAIRFANVGLWNQSDGVNTLVKDLVVLHGVSRRY